MRFVHFPLIFLLLFAFACGLGRNTHAIIHTDLGSIQVRLFDSTPLYRDNFIFSSSGDPLLFSGDSLFFYRIERDFAIQFGPEPGENVRDFAIKSNIEAPMLIGALAARKGSLPDYSDGNDFFIVLGRPQTDVSLDEVERKTSIHFSRKERDLYKKHGGLPQLHGQYTVFGEVVSGMETAQKIAALPRDSTGRPLQDIRVWVEISSSGQ